MLLIPFVIAGIESDADRKRMQDIYIKHYKMMFSIAMRYTRQKAEADDIVSESCVSLIKHLDQLRDMEDEPLRRYIATTTKNEAIRFNRKTAREKEVFLRLPDTDELNCEDTLSLESKICLREEIETVRDAVHRLPERQQMVLRQKIYEGDSYKEIAERLGIDEGSVRNILWRARKRLANMLYEGDDK